MKNRIRYWRKLRNFSGAELAARIGTTQPTIQRLERGQQPLTSEWMEKLAEALSVNEIDLLSIAAAAGLSDDLSPETVLISDPIYSALKARGIATFKVLTDVLSALGVLPNSVHPFDVAEARISAAKTGDIVAVEAIDKTDDERRYVLLRQFVRPGLFCTNRGESNTVFSISDPNIDAKIIGILESEDVQN